MKQSLTPDSSALVVVLDERWLKNIYRDLDQVHARGVIANEIASKMSVTIGENSRGKGQT